MGSRGIHLRLASEIAQARERGAPEIVHQSLGLFGSDFERAREPAAQRAVEKRVADKKHEDYRKKRKRHGADDHFGFEARAQLLLAAFRPEANDGAR